MATARPTCSPLTDEHCNILDKVLQGCSTQDELLGLCNQAGLTGTDKYVADNHRIRQMANGIKSSFFPDRY